MKPPEFIKTAIRNKHSPITRISLVVTILEIKIDLMLLVVYTFLSAKYVQDAGSLTSTKRR